MSGLCISQVFSNVRNVLSQCNTPLRLLHSDLLYDIDFTCAKQDNTLFPFILFKQ